MSYLERVTGCEVCGLAETIPVPGDHFDQVGEWCDGSGGSRVRVEPDYEGMMSDAHLSLVEPCTTCDGTGKCKCRGEMHVCAPPPFGNCPVCAGSGVVPSEQAIEAGARSAFAGARSAFEVVRVQLSMAHWEGTTEHNRRLYRNMSRAVLVALLEGTDE